MGFSERSVLSAVSVCWQLAAAGRARMNTASEACCRRYQLAGIFFTRELLYSGASVHKFSPLEIVFDEVIKSCCCNFNVCAVCELDRHSRLPRVVNFLHLLNR